MIDWVVFSVAALPPCSRALGVVVLAATPSTPRCPRPTLFCVAVFFVLQEAHFLAAVQVIVYAGAIVVLFLFVIMLLGVDRRRTSSEPLGQRPWPWSSGLSVGGLAVLCWPARDSPRWPAARVALGDGPRATSSPGRGALHPLPVRLRDHVGPARHRRRRCRGARPRLGDSPTHEPRPPWSTGARSTDGVTLCPGAYLVARRPALFTIGAVGLLVRRNVLVMFMCVELMLNAVNLTFVTFASTLNDVGGQVVVFFTLVVAAAEVVVGLGHHRRHLPPPAARHRRRRRPAAGVTTPVLEAVWLIPALPLAGFLLLLGAGRRMGDPKAGWLATAMMGGSFIPAVGRVPRSAGPRRRARSLRAHPVLLDPAGVSTSTSASSSTRCRSRWRSSSPASEP